MKTLNRVILLAMVIAITMVFYGCGSSAKQYGVEQPSDAVVTTIAYVKSNPQDDRDLALDGEISELCQHSGCWMYLSDKKGRIYVTFLDFFLPLDAIGKDITIWGGPMVTDKGDVEFVAEGAVVK